MKNKLATSLTVLGMIFTTGYIAGCSSTPKNVTPISTAADSSTEVSSTRSELEALRADLGEHLAPTKFKNAEKSLLAAEKALADKKSSEKVLEELAKSRAWLEQAQVVTNRSKTALAQPLLAREKAMAIADIENKELRHADEELADAAKKIEKGDGITDQKKAELTVNYIKAERMRITRTQLDPIENRIEQAKQMKAKKLAPKSFARAESDFIAAQKTLRIDPIDRDQIKERIDMASTSSNELLEVSRETAKTPGASTEELVLAARRRDRMVQRQLSNADAKLENAMEGNARVQAENERLKGTVSELSDEAKPQALLQKLRTELPEDTADISMTPAGKIMVRVKQLQFKTNSADLTPAAAAVLNDVKSALAEIEPKRLTIEGHTDSTGSATRNKELSASRADAVASVLKTDEQLSQAQIETKGLGAEQPIKNNQTKEGRAENRRVEITIDTL